MTHTKIAKNKFTSILILFCSFVFLSPSFTLAQEVHPYSIEKLTDTGQFRDFVVGPGKTELTLQPGQSATVNVLATNRTGETRTFFIETEDFKGSHNTEQTVVFLGDERGPYSLKDYLRVPSYRFDLEHGERATIPVIVSVPLDAEPGGKYGSLIISTTSKEGEKRVGSASTALISRVGTLFFVTVPGEVERNGSLENFKTKTGRKIFGGGPIGFEILFRNTGSVHLNPYGEIRITNLLGKEVEAFEIDPWFAMPDSLRLREVSWERDWIFGIYTAHASINRGYDDIIDESNFTFLVIPWKIALGVFLAVIIFVLLLRFIFRRFEFKRKT